MQSTNLNLRWLEVSREDGRETVDGSLDCLIMVVVFLLLELLLEERISLKKVFGMEHDENTEHKPLSV